MSINSSEFVNWFRSAAPYIHAHRRKTFVLHFGGELIESDILPQLVHDIALMNSLGIRMVIVFGARKQIDALLNERGISTRLVKGLRVTDESMLPSVREAAGSARVQIEALLSMGLPNSPMAGSQVKVTSGNFVIGKPYGVLDGVDLEHTGMVRRIDKDTICKKLDNNEVVIIPPLGYSPTGEVFNLSSIEIAANVAISIEADKLLFLIQEDGLKDKAGKFIFQMTQVEAEQLLAESDVVDIPPYLQLVHGLKASQQGVERIHFIDQTREGGLLQELFTRDGIGTLLSAAPFDLIRPATINDVGGILELIQPLEEQGILVRRSREKMETEIGDYTVLIRDGAVIACSALHVYKTEQLAELACLAVSEEYQKESKGKGLYLAMEKEAEKRGVKKIFVLTTQTTHWFLEQGFSEADVDDLPISRQELYNYKRNSKVLLKDLG